jgi:hypothetical protein
MRALAIRRRAGMNDDCLIGLEQPMQVGHRHLGWLDFSVRRIMLQGGSQKSLGHSNFSPIFRLTKLQPVAGKRD